jgi:hypothetical protein
MPEVAKSPYHAASRRPLERDECPEFASGVLLGALGLEKDGRALQREPEIPGRVEVAGNAGREALACEGSGRKPSRAPRGTVAGAPWARCRRRPSARSSASIHEELSPPGVGRAYDDGRLAHPRALCDPPRGWEVQAELLDPSPEATCPGYAAVPLLGEQAISWNIDRQTRPLGAASRRGFSGLKTTGTPFSFMRSPTESPLLILQHLRRWASRGALASGLQEHVPGDVVMRGRWAVRFIRPRQVLEMIGVSRSTLWRMVQEGSFPQPLLVPGGK